MTAVGTARRSSVSRLFVTLLALATFGPYVVGSIRTEQAVVYGAVVLLFPWIVVGFSSRGGLRFLIPWTLYGVVATIAVIFPHRGVSPYPTGSLLGGYDNILLPIALMLLIWSIVPDEDAQESLVRFCKIIAAGMAINGVIAIASTRTDLSAFLRPFWATGELNTVANNAAEMGRFSGIFNQPAEAGALYGIAGLAAIYAWSHRAVLSALLVTLITLGGLISVSKVFVFGGLPAIVLYWLWTQRGGRKISLIFGLALITLGVIQSGILAQWTGANYLGRLFVSTDGNLLALYSAGRFSDESFVAVVVDAVMRTSPVAGVGAAGWKAAYDNVVAETMVTAGILGVGLMVFVILGLFLLWRKFTGSLRVFAFLFAVVTAGGALGFSPLTANRVSTVSWVIIALFVVIGRNSDTNPGDTLARRHHATASTARRYQSS